MKYFISYRHTGAEGPELDALQHTLKDAFDTRGDEFNSTYFDQETFNDSDMDWAQIMCHVLKLIDSMDVLFIVVNSEHKSEGMLIEVGYCLAKNKKIIVAKDKAVQGLYFPTLITEMFEYDGLQDLHEKIITLQQEP